MTRGTAIMVLALAALLEAGGDAVVRLGMRSPSPVSRALLFVAGAAVLFAYGWTVNAPRWDFGKLLGIYVVLFFVTAQMVSWLAFGETPGRAVFIGGALIVAGGVVIALG
jgi:hypothetical protein